MLILFISNTEKFFLVEWHCDKNLTVVQEKHIRARDGPITKGKDYFVTYGSKFLEAKVLAIGMFNVCTDAHWHKNLHVYRTIFKVKLLCLPFC